MGSSPGRVIAIIVLIVVAAGGLTYRFYNYREEGAVAAFLEEVSAGRLDQAFARWDVEGSSYTHKDFESDWGKNGYYMKGGGTPTLVDSNSRGKSVIVYIEIATFSVPEALLVNKETLKLSYAPNNKYKAEK